MFSSFFTLNLAANSKSANLLSGDINEFVTVPSLVNVYASSSAVGTRISVFADSDIAIDDKEINAIGTTLLKSDHLLDSFAVGAGTRLAAFLRDVSGAATNDINTGFEVLPL